MGPEWLPDIESDLRKYDEHCYSLISQGSFDEELFTKYFQNMESYLQICLKYKLTGKYDESRMKRIAEYYNDHTNTMNYYDPINGRKSEVVRYRNNNKSNDEEQEDKVGKWLKKSEPWANKLLKFDLYAAIVILILFLLRSCAHGEEITSKYVLVDKNGKKIEFMDNNYQMPTEEINPMDYRIKTR